MAEETSDEKKISMLNKKITELIEKSIQEDKEIYEVIARKYELLTKNVSEKEKVTLLEKKCCDMLDILKSKSDMIYDLKDYITKIDSEINPPDKESIRLSEEISRRIDDLVFDSEPVGGSAIGYDYGEILRHLRKFYED